MAEAELERPEDAGDGGEGRVKYWRIELDLAAKHEAAWMKRGDATVKRYRDEKRKAGKKFNILWANVETLKPATYSQTPAPDIRRRFKDKDPVGRVASEVLERALSFSVDDYPFDETMEAVRDDMLLPGRGVARVVYEPQFVKMRPQIAQIPNEADPSGIFLPPQEIMHMNGEPVEPDGEDDEGPYVEEIGEQDVYCEYVYWKDLRLFPSGVRRWEDVYGVAFCHTMTRDELKEAFPGKGSRIPLTHSALPEEDERRDDASAEPLKKAVVWEIWDKRTRERVWIAQGFDELIETEDDPYGLEDFFPIPKPVYAVQTTDTLVPIPEFTQYQDQADELDLVTARINKLTEALKVRGLYAGVIKELRDLMKGDENSLHPVDDWEQIVQHGGLDKAITWFPIEKTAQVLGVLIQNREALKQEIFEITGISDIIRGATDARETKGAQQLKANFGAQRMTPRSKPIERFARDLFRLKAEIIAEHFTQDQLQRMTGQQIPEPVMQLLRDEKARGFRIDVETDSTVAPDAAQEKAEATEFVTAVTGFLTAATELGQAAPVMTPVLMEMLKYSVRRFKAGRSLEEVIDQSADAVTQQAQQPQQPDPEQQAKAQAIQQDAEAKAQAQQTNAALAQQQMQFKQQLDTQKAELERVMALLEAQGNEDRAERKLEADIELKKRQAAAAERASAA